MDADLMVSNVLRSSWRRRFSRYSCLPTLIQNNKTNVSNGSISTDGYMLIAETKPIKPGEWNSQELAVKKTPLYTIPHTATDPKTGVKLNIQW